MGWVDIDQPADWLLASAPPHSLSEQAMLLAGLVQRAVVGSLKACLPMF